MTGLRGSILSMLLALIWPLVCAAQDGADTAAEVQRLMDQLGSRHAPDRLAAIRGLAELGPAAAEAVYALSGVIADDETANQRAGVAALGAIGPAALGELAMVEYNDSPWLRKLAILHVRKIVWRAESPPEGALEIFLDGMGDDHSSVRGMAAVGAGDLGPAAEQAVPRLIELTQDAATAQGAAYALGKIGPAAQAAVPSLVNLLQSTGSSDRRHAAVALAQIGPVEDETVGPALVGLMSDSAPYVRWAGAWTLGELGVNSAEARAALVTALGDDDTDVRAAAANALSKIHPSDEQGLDPPAASSQAVPTLMDLIDSDDSRVRWAAVWALGEARGAALSAVPKLQELLEAADTPLPLRAAALNALGKISPSAPAVLAALQQAAESDDEVMRNVALDRLGDAGHAASDSVD